MFKIALFLHIIAAIFWIGGMLFLTLVLAPFLKTIGDAQKRSEIYQTIGRRYRFWGWLAIVILLITGPINFYYLGVSPSTFFNMGFYETSYGKTALLKIMFVVLAVLTSAIHDFWLGPGARSSKGYSWWAMVMGRGNLLLALIIAALAALLRAGG